jgi:hypothetical protein
VKGYVNKSQAEIDSSNNSKSKQTDITIKEKLRPKMSKNYDK